MADDKSDKLPIEIRVEKSVFSVHIIIILKINGMAQPLFTVKYGETNPLLKNILTNSILTSGNELYINYNQKRWNVGKETTFEAANDVCKKYNKQLFKKQKKLSKMIGWNINNYEIELKRGVFMTFTLYESIMIAHVRHIIIDWVNFEKLNDSLYEDGENNVIWCRYLCDSSYDFQEHETFLNIEVINGELRINIYKGRSERIMYYRDNIPLEKQNKIVNHIVEELDIFNILTKHKKKLIKFLKHPVQIL